MFPLLHSHGYRVWKGLQQSSRSIFLPQGRMNCPCVIPDGCLSHLKTTRDRHSAVFLVLCSLHHLKAFSDIYAESFLLQLIPIWKQRTDCSLSKCLFNVMQNLSSLPSAEPSQAVQSLLADHVLETFDLPAFLWSLSNLSACPLKCALKPYANCLESLWYLRFHCFLKEIEALSHGLRFLLQASTFQANGYNETL